MRAIAIVTTIALIGVSCKKDTIDERKSLIGLWKMSSVSLSSGSPEEPPARLYYLEFTNDHRMTFEWDNQSTTCTYTVTSDSTLHVALTPEIDRRYKFNLRSNVLTLFPLACSGCAYKYEAVNNR